jgi:hypothetical protein
MKLLELIRAWKNRTFKDWVWDLLLGFILGLIGLLTQVEILVLVIPIVFTIINQFINKLFEPKDFIYRTIIPIIIYTIINN